MIKHSKAYKYAQWCLEDHRYVGKYVKLQALAWIKIVDGDDPEAWIDEEEFERISNILKLMNHPDVMTTDDDGRQTNATLYDSIEDYAWWLIIATFCTKHIRKVKKTNSRYYQTVLLEICRKNFKTFYSAIIFIIGMLIEPQFSRFFSVAPDFKLSNELRLAVRKIIKVSPALAERFKINRDMILCKITDSEYVPLAYSNDRMDGKLANIFLADEAGAMDSYPVEAMRSSQITLLNKLGIIISTQYPNDNNVMIDEIDHAKKVLDGLKDNKRTFALLYEPDDDLIKEWETNDLVIYQSNPVAYANEMVFEAILDKRVAAVEYENKRENYLCKHNNIQYQGLGTEGFIGIDKVKPLKIIEDPLFWRGKLVYLGLDLSITDDNTSVAMVTEWKGKIYAKVVGFLPSEKIEIKSKNEGVDYKKFIAQKNCYACGEEILDYAFVEKYILGLEKKYGVEVAQIGYDRMNAMSTAQKLEEHGLEVVEVKQHSSVLHPATKLLYESILNKSFQYEDNRLLEINFQNSRCTYDTNMNKYINKKKSAGKVDMVVSLIIALYLLQQEQLNGKDVSIYVV